MDSFSENGKQWVACHECEFGGNGTLKNCDIGENILQCRFLNRGCWAGMLIPEIKAGEKSEIHN